MNSIEQTVENFLDAEPVTFPVYILSKAKKMFGSDNLNNDDVCEYFCQNLKTFDKKVGIEEDDGIGYSHYVYYADVDDPSINYAIFCGSEEECKKFCTDKGLIINE